MKNYINSLQKVWNNKTLTEKDYNNLGDLMLVAIAILVIQLIIF